jgi:hypothetical protein
MFWTIPRDNNTTIKELPPALKNGKGMPVTGKSPTFMLMFITMWVNKRKNTPPAIYIPKSSLLFRMTAMILESRNTYNPKIALTPTNPISSLLAAKIKSVWRSGKNRCWLCAPCANPCPNICPLPTAIIAWRTARVEPGV